MAGVSKLNRSIISNGLRDTFHLTLKFIIFINNVFYKEMASRRPTVLENRSSGPKNVGDDFGHNRETAKMRMVAL